MTKNSMILPTISIRQPWAWFIVNGWKDIENRTWKLPKKYIGKPVFIHAGKHFKPGEIVDIIDDVKMAGMTKPKPAALTLNEVKEQCGGIVGVAVFSGCVQNSDSPWASGEPRTWHWQIEKASPVEMFRCKGQLSFFGIDYPYGPFPTTV